MLPFSGQYSPSQQPVLYHSGPIPTYPNFMIIKNRRTCNQMMKTHAGTRGMFFRLLHYSLFSQAKKAPLPWTNQRIKTWPPYNDKKRNTQPLGKAIAGGLGQEISGCSQENTGPQTGPKYRYVREEPVVARLSSYCRVALSLGLCKKKLLCSSSWLLVTLSK